MIYMYIDRSRFYDSYFGEERKKAQYMITINYYN